MIDCEIGEGEQNLAPDALPQSCRPNSTCFCFRYGITGSSISVRRGMSVRAVTSLLWNRPPMNGSRSLMLTSSTAFSEMSIPTHFLPSLSAAMHAVAHPQNGSNTTSSGLVARRDYALVSRAEGLLVWGSRLQGHVQLGPIAPMSSQTSWSFSPRRFVEILLQTRSAIHCGSIPSVPDRGVPVFVPASISKHAHAGALSTHT